MSVSELLGHPVCVPHRRRRKGDEKKPPTAPKPPAAAEEAKPPWAPSTQRRPFVSARSANFRNDSPVYHPASPEALDVSFCCIFAEFRQQFLFCKLFDPRRFVGGSKGTVRFCVLSALSVRSSVAKCCRALNEGQDDKKGMK